MNIQKVDALLQQYEKNVKPKNSRRITFKGVEGYDVYNPSNIFDYQGTAHIVGRVEKRDEEKSTAVFFKKVDDLLFVKNEDLPTFSLQDPFISKVSGYIIFGGTDVFEEKGDTYWRTVLYKGKSIKNLTRFFEAPIGMKDVRLAQFKDGRYALFTRPQGQKNGRGKIGIQVEHSMDNFTTESIKNAPVFDQLPEESWLGANEIIPLYDGKLGVLGHVATFSSGTIRQYYPVVFTVNPITLEPSPMKIIATRKDFLNGPSKREDLKDVLFSGGLTLKDENATLIVGVSDCEVQAIDIKNPFKDME